MEMMDLVKERVKILFAGTWKEKQVEIVEDDRYLPEITEEMKAAAEARFTARKAKNPKLYDGDAFHLDLTNSVIQPNRLVLAIGKMKYSIYDIARKEYAEKYGWKSVPSGMGTVVIVVASDAKIVMHRRISSVDHAAKISAIGGIYSGEPPFADIRTEIMEELKIEEKEVKTLLLIGIYARLDERVNHGLAFFAQTLLSSKDILEREKTLTEKEGEIFFLDAKKKSIYAYLEENHRNIISDTFAGLVLAAKHLLE